MVVCVWVKTGQEEKATSEKSLVRPSSRRTLSGCPSYPGRIIGACPLVLQKHVPCVPFLQGRPGEPWVAYPSKCPRGSAANASSGAQSEAPG